MRARRSAVAAALASALPAALGGVVAWQARRAVGAEYLPEPEYEVDVRLGEGGEELRLAVLGDSTVAGIGSPSPAVTVPALVGERVAGLLSRPVRAVGHGVSGARTTDIAAQASKLAGDRPDVVLIVIGSNDVTHVTPLWLMRGRTIDMLESVRDVVGDVPIVLGGIPEFGTVPALDRPLRTLAGAYAVRLRGRQRAAAADAGVAFVDIAAEASPRFLGRPESMSADGFHPSDVGYGLWADALAPALADALAQATSTSSQR